MEIVTFYKYEVKIIALFLIIATQLKTTICQNEIIQFYANEDNGYDEEYGSIIDNDDDDENDSNFPVKSNIISDTASNITIRQTTKCDENQLMTYLAKLQVTNPESLLLIASYKDLENLCRRIAGNLDSIDSFMQTCTPLPQDHLYMQLIAGLRVLNAKLCMESDYQKNYQNHLSCFHELHAEYIDCAGPADWTENMDHNELCNEYKLIADCYYTKSAMLCGIKGAKIMKELVVRVVNGIINTHCPELRKNPIVLNPMSDSISSKVSASSEKRFFLHNLNIALLIITEIITAVSYFTRFLFLL